MQGILIQKRRLIWILGIAIALIIVVASGCKDKNARDPGISKAEYDQLTYDLTYDQVKAIIGGPGELFMEMGAEGDAQHIVTYQYIGEEKQGAAQLIFVNDILNQKIQYMLK